jgi:hypothetical protein
MRKLGIIAALPLAALAVGVSHVPSQFRTMTKFMYPDSPVNIYAGERALTRPEAQNIQGRFDKFVLNGNTCRE